MKWFTLGVAAIVLAGCSSLGHEVASGINNSQLRNTLGNCPCRSRRDIDRASQCFLVLQIGDEVLPEGQDRYVEFHVSGNLRLEVRAAPEQPDERHVEPMRVLSHEGQQRLQKEVALQESPVQVDAKRNRWRIRMSVGGFFSGRP